MTRRQAIKTLKDTHKRLTWLGPGPSRVKHHKLQALRSEAREIDERLDDHPNFLMEQDFLEKLDRIAIGKPQGRPRRFDPRIIQSPGSFERHYMALCGTQEWLWSDQRSRYKTTVHKFLKTANHILKGFPDLLDQFPLFKGSKTSLRKYTAHYIRCKKFLRNSSQPVGGGGLEQVTKS
jgi:hypothetical protein